jgi:hypothetical protein
MQVQRAVCAMAWAIEPLLAHAEKSIEIELSRS